MMLINLVLKRTYRPSSNTIQWNKMIKNHQANGNYQQALKLFQIGIDKQTFQPDSVTYLTVIDICKQSKSLSTLRSIHQLIDSSKTRPNHEDVSKNSRIRSLLMDAFVKCQDIENAYQVFQSMNERNLIDYCGLMTGFNQQKQYEKTFELYQQIPSTIKYSSPVLSTLVLQACTELKQYNDGLEIHRHCQKFLPQDKMLLNEIFNFYLKFHQENQALDLFNKYAKHQTIIDYSLFMKYYNQTFQPEKTIDLYYKLKTQTKLSIDHIIYVLVLQAIANACCLHTSKQIQDDIRKFGMNLDIQNALINMYGKLGDLDQAEKMFSSMTKHNIVSYNILLNLYGLYRQSDRALKCFNQMCQQGYRPDEKTYVLLLHTLSQTPNKINDVKRIFSSIEQTQRGPLVITTMIAALTRADLYDEVNQLLNTLPKENIFYYAIKANSNEAFLKKFNYPNSITYEQLALYDLLMSNLYTYAGLQDNWTVINEFLNKKSMLTKILSRSWFEKSNGQIEYFENKTSNFSSCSHSEKVAIEKAIEEQKESSLPILIGKNHRTCADCHSYFKQLSFSRSEKKLILRDSTCFHAFSSGQCIYEDSF